MKKKNKRKKPVKKTRLIYKILAGILIAVLSLAIVLVMAGIGIYCYIFTDYSEATVTLDVEKIGISENAPKNDLFHVAVFGVDSETSHVGRADSIMILTIDREHKQLKVTSILRDTLLSVKGHGEDKINHSYAYGGAELLLHTINQNFDMDISEYVVLDFEDVAMLVDAIGGLDMEITEAERVQLNGNLTDKSQKIERAGKVHLNGKQVTAFGRIRKIDNEVERAGRQRYVIQCVLDKVKETDLLQYPKLLHDFLPLLETTLTQGELTNAAMDAMLCDFNAKEHVIPGDEDKAWGGIYKGMWCWRYDIDAAAKRWHKFLENQA